MQIDLSDAIRTLVEACLPVGHDPKKFMTVSFTACYTNYTQKDEGGRYFEARSGQVVLGFHRPYGSTKVFVLVKDINHWSPCLREHIHHQLKDSWLCLSNHDSCWKTDGVERICSELHETLLEKAGISHPVDVHNHHLYVNFEGTNPRMCRADIEQINTDPFDRKYEVVVKGEWKDD